MVKEQLLINEICSEWKFNSNSFDKYNDELMSTCSGVVSIKFDGWLKGVMIAASISGMHDAYELAYFSYILWTYRSS